MSTATKSRPNKNHVLQVMRDDDFEDPWGTGMSWAFACAEVLYDADPHEVPTAMEYRPSLAGPEVPNTSDRPEVNRITIEDISWPTAYIWCWLHNLDESDPAGHPDVEDLPYWKDPAFRLRAIELREACVLLNRYLAWCKAAGKDY